MLEKLLEIDQINKILINTDAPDLISIDKTFASNRVQIRPRKPSLCGDTVSMNLVIEDDLLSEKADCYLMTHTTNPLLKVKTIEKAIELFKCKLIDRKADSLFTVNKIQSRFYDQHSKPVNHNPEKLIPTQDLKPIYEENSNLYLFTKESFRKTHARIGKNPIMLETTKLESIDIDDEEDWNLASLVCKSMFNL